MNYDTILILQIIMVISPVVSFLYSIKLIQLPNTPVLFKAFFIYNLATLFEILLFWLVIFKIINRVTYQYYNLIGLLFNFCFLSFFIIKNYYFSKAIIIFYSLGLLCLLFTIKSIIPEFNYYTGKALVLPHLGLLILSMVYFVQFYRHNLKVDLIFDSSFWVITGIFSCSVLVTPLMAIREFLKQSISLQSFYLFAFIGVLAYTIMHLFFIKAFVCLIRKLT